MTAQASNHGSTFRLPEMLSYHSTWDDADPAPQLPRPGLLARMVEAVGTRVRTARARRAEITALRAMSDTELADLRLTRSGVANLFDPKSAQGYTARGASRSQC